MKESPVIMIYHGFWQVSINSILGWLLVFILKQYVNYTDLTFDQGCWYSEFNINRKGLNCFDVTSLYQSTCCVYHVLTLFIRTVLLPFALQYVLNQLHPPTHSNFSLLDPVPLALFTNWNIGMVLQPIVRKYHISSKYWTGFHSQHKI